MKILLVNPISQNLSLSSPDLGLGYLATALKKENHDVRILDCVNLQMNFEKFEHHIRHLDFDVIGLKVFSTDLLSVEKSVSIVKKNHPQAFIILGGAHPSAFPEQTLQYFTQADFAIRGEAEKALSELINLLPRPTVTQKTEIPGLIWRNHQKIVVNSPNFPEDLDALGMPDWSSLGPLHYAFQTSYFTKSKMVAPLIMTRGCPYRCTFCSSRSITGHRIRSHSVDYIIREIKYLISRFGIKEFCFVDDNFLVLKNQTAELCEKMIREKLNIRWSCFGIRLNLVDRDILKLMEKSGCYLLTVGIESGSQRILDHMKKNLTVELIEEKINLIRKETSMKIIGNFIIGYPEEREDDIYKTIHFAKMLPLFAANFFPFHPMPGTEIFDQLTANNDSKNIDWTLMGQDRIPYVPPGMSRKKISWLFFLAYAGFYIRPSIMINVLSVLRSPGKLTYIFRRIARILCGRAS